jgi:hypothetical protein
MEGDPSPFEITETLLEDEILPRVLTFSTSLLATTERTETDATPCGSGTFVATGGRRCLLTAEHVWRRVQRYGPWLLLTLDHSVSASREHPLAVDVQFMGPPRYITTRASDEWGPDLALLHLPDLYAEKAQEAKAFYNLDARREAALASDVSHTTGLWAVLGAPAEHSSVEPEGRVMQTYVFGSTIKRATVRDGFDYLDLTIKGRMKPALRSFGGVSGAGLWRCNLRRSPTGTVESDQPALEGVAFYERLDREGRGFIRCHGRASIYRRALEAGGRLWPSQPG